ncbi:MAG: SAM-dependent methyltransferase [Polyangiales bacterium]
MRDEWASAFTDKARAYWTRERLDDLVRGKDLNVLPHEAPSLLRALGILHRDGSMPPAQRRKFFQCNHMVAALGPSLRELVAARTDEPVRLVDAACGRSYLTLLLAHTLEHRYRVPVQVLAVDRNAELVEESARRTTMAGLDATVKHFASPLARLDVREAFASQFGGARPSRIDAVVSLHACNTATDDAIELGVRADATLLALTPCCHAELAAQWKELAPTSAGPFAPIHRTPHLRRETASIVTDTMRALLLRAMGYESWALELVPTEHTPKNTLLRAMFRGHDDGAALQQYRALKESTGGAGIALAERLSALQKSRT